jgi:hypothetical protein
MMAAVSLETRMFRHCGKNHSAIDEEPFFPLSFPLSFPSKWNLLVKRKSLPALFFICLLGTSTALADLQENPAEIYFLGISSPAVRSLGDEMMASARAIAQQKESYFDATTDVCALDKTGFHALMGMDADREREMQQAMQQQYGVSTQKSVGWLKLTKGSCRNGLPEGDFVATVQVHERITYPGNFPPRDYTNLYRIKGKMVDGKREGLSVTESLMIDNTAPDSPYGRTPVLFAQTFSKGKAAEIGITVAGTTNLLVSREVDTGYGRKRFVKTYANGALLSENQQLNNLTHGEQIVFIGNKETRTCWSFGQMAKSLRECDAFKLPPSLLAKLNSRQVDGLALADNTGAYISPYTVDGTLAEWVNAVVVVDMGASIGTLVGSIGGAAAAGMLDFIPYGLGGLAAAAIGGHFGKQIGKAQGLEAAGGMDKLRADSDMSFSSLNDMAVYLSAKYGDAVTFADAIRAASVIYPDLPKAISTLK